MSNKKTSLLSFKYLCIIPVLKCNRRDTGLYQQKTFLKGYCGIIPFATINLPCAVCVSFGLKTRSGLIFRRLSTSGRFGNRTRQSLNHVCRPALVLRAHPHRCPTGQAKLRPELYPRVSVEWFWPTRVA